MTDDDAPQAKELESETNDPIERDIDVFTPQFEGRREENLEQINFETVRQSREAGQVYQNSDFDTPLEAVREVCNQLDIDQERAYELLRVYTSLYTVDARDMNGHAIESGLKFYAGESINEIADQRDRSVEKLQKDIRAFVGAVIKEIDISEIDLNQQLPNSPPNPLEKAIKELAEDLPDLSSIIPRVEVFTPQLDFAIDPTPLVESIKLNLDVAKSISKSLEAIDGIDDLDDEVGAEFETEITDARVIESEESPREAPVSDSSVRHEGVGTQTVSSVGNIDEETASKLYNTWWDAAKTAINNSRAAIDDTHLSALAAICAIITVYTGNVGSALAFLYLFIEKLTAYSGGEQ